MTVRELITELEAGIASGKWRGEDLAICCNRCADDGVTYEASDPIGDTLIRKGRELTTPNMLVPIARYPEESRVAVVIL